MSPTPLVFHEAEPLGMLAESQDFKILKGPDDRGLLESLPSDLRTVVFTLSKEVTLQPNTRGTREVVIKITLLENPEDFEPQPFGRNWKLAGKVFIGGAHTELCIHATYDTVIQKGILTFLECFSTLSQTEHLI